MTLLEKFISRKLKAYKEPERTGTPKGVKVGFSRAKYHASLLSLKKTKVVELAAMLGLSHGLIRNWRTEPEFHAVVREHLKEFGKDINAHLFEHGMERFDAAFADAREWSEKILPAIPTKPIPATTEESRVIFGVHRLAGLIGDTEANEIQTAKENWGAMSKRLTPERRLLFVRAHVKDSKKILRKSTLTAADRRQLRVRMEIIEKLLG